MSWSTSSDYPASETPQETPPERQGGGGGKRLRYVVVILLLIVVVAAGFGARMLTKDGSEEEVAPIFTGEERPLDQVSTNVFPAELLWRFPLETANMPSDIAVLDGRVFVLDTSNNRILELDDGGDILQVMDSESDSRLTLTGPMAMTADDERLYISNSGSGNIVVLNPDGRVEKVITPQVSPSDYPLRPIGIAVANNGHIFLSDPDNHRILLLDQDGGVVSSLGSGARDSGEYGFNTPGGLSLDTQGNLYVVDMLNYAVKKYSPADQFVLSLGEAGDTEGTFSRPKVVAVDGDGRIFVSDTVLVSVAVFGTDGEYAGFIGREDPEDITSGSMFQAPHGMKVVDDTLYVVDRFAGLFAFQLPEDTIPTPSAD